VALVVIGMRHSLLSDPSASLPRSPVFCPNLNKAADAVADSDDPVVAAGLCY